MENKKFIKTLLEGQHIDESSLTEREKADKKSLETVLVSSSGLLVPQGRTKLQAWQMLEEKITSNEKSKTKVVKMPFYKKPYKLITSLAAVLTLALVAFYFLLYNPSTIVSVPKGVQATIYLPDESKVILNADSKLKYSKRNWSKDRRVSLKGEALFEVKKGSKFTVVSKSGMVEVLGTTFNVYNRTKHYEVKCHSGKVQVVTAGKEDEPKVLEAGAAVLKNLDGTLTEPYKFKKQNALWHKGEFYFQEKELSMVLGEVERQFDVQIDFSGDDSRVYTGPLTNKDLSDALELICKPMGLQFEINGKSVTIE